MKILVVEDDPKVARFLVRALGGEGYAVDLCALGADAAEQARTGVYDAIVLDWMLPDRDGLSVCREIRRAGSRAPVLMVTARSEVEERVAALDAGADDFLAKPFHILELLARVRALLRRASGHAQLVAGAGFELDRARRAAVLDGKSVELTGREYALLLHLAERADEVVSRAELLEGVWSTGFDPGSNLVEVHVSHLRDKLGERAWMIETVRGAGYRLRTRRPA